MLDHNFYIFFNYIYYCLVQKHFPMASKHFYRVRRHRTENGIQPGATKPFLSQLSEECYFGISVRLWLCCTCCENHLLNIFLIFITLLLVVRNTQRYTSTIACKTAHADFAICRVRDSHSGLEGTLTEINTKKFQQQAGHSNAVIICNCCACSAFCRVRCRPDNVRQ